MNSDGLTYTSAVGSRHAWHAFQFDALARLSSVLRKRIIALA